VWLISNPVAGGGRGSRNASIATKALHEARIHCRLLHPASTESSAAAAADAVAAGASAVIACGGDGTVHTILQELVHTQVPLGVMAGGSGDDIAACLGFPVSNPEAAAAYLVACLLEGSTRQVDLGRARTADGTDRYFLGVLSSGFDSAVNERANTMTRLGGQRYNAAIVRELASFRPLDYDVTIDGERMTEQGMLVAVGNGPSYGGGMQICPAAVPDDGTFDVTWLGAVSTLTFLRVFPKVFKGTHVQHPSVRTYTGQAITIDAPGQVAYADGERIGPLPVAIQMQSHALHVLTSGTRSTT
jgi:diacylglycerol kinase (ATP)